MSTSAEKLLEALKRDQNRKSSQKMKRLITKDEGKYKIRILPNENSQEGLPYERVFIHFGFKHPNYNTPSTFRCLGRDCPLCGVAKKLKEDGDDSAWRFKSTPVYLYYIVDSNEELLYAQLTQKAHSEVFSELSAKARANINPVDLDNGRVAELKLSKIDGKYSWKCSFANEKSVVSDSIKSQLKLAQPLSEIYRHYTKEELESVASGEKLDYSGAVSDNSSTVDPDVKKQNPIKGNHTEDDSIEARKAKIRAQLEEEDE